MNSDLLKNKLREVGISEEDMAKAMGISKDALENRLNGKTEFTLKDIIAVVQILGLDRRETGQIFFGTEVS